MRVFFVFIILMSLSLLADEPYAQLAQKLTLYADEKVHFDQEQCSVALHHAVCAQSQYAELIKQWCNHDVQLDASGQLVFRIGQYMAALEHQEHVLLQKKLLLSKKRSLQHLQQEHRLNNHLITCLVCMLCITGYALHMC